MTRPIEIGDWVTFRGRRGQVVGRGWRDWNSGNWQYCFHVATAPEKFDHWPVNECELEEEDDERQDIGRDVAGV